ncbi:alpha/beta fold hydrolase [Gemmatimonadota bacterium]
MYYETVGEGEPLVLLHGWSGTGHDYDPFVPEFSKHYRLILPDLRGHGRSTNPGKHSSMGQSASDVLALLDHLGLNRVRAIGASMGGITLYHMAIREPARIERMVTIGAGSHFPVACNESMAATTAESYPEEWWEVMRTRHVHGEEQSPTCYLSSRRMTRTWPSLPRISRRSGQEHLLCTGTGTGASPPPWRPRSTRPSLRRPSGSCPMVVTFPSRALIRPSSPRLRWPSWGARSEKRCGGALPALRGRGVRRRSPPTPRPKRKGVADSWQAGVREPLPSLAPDAEDGAACLHPSRSHGSYR